MRIRWGMGIVVGHSSGGGTRAMTVVAADRLSGVASAVVVMVMMVVMMMMGIVVVLVGWADTVAAVVVLVLSVVARTARVAHNVQLSEWTGASSGPIRQIDSRLSGAGPPISRVVALRHSRWYRER